MPTHPNEQQWYNYNQQSKKETKIRELKFLRIVSLIGFLIVPIVSIAFSYFRPQAESIHYARMVLALYSGLCFFASYRYSQWAKKYNQEMIFGMLLFFSVIQIFNNYNLNFPPLDLTTNISNILILGAVLNRKRYMMTYMVLSVVFFLFLFSWHPDPLSDRTLVYINTPLVTAFVLFIYNNKIQNLNEIKESKRRLIENENHFRTVFERAPMGITVLNRQGKVVQFNQAILDILDFSPEEYIQADPIEYVYEEDYETFDDLYNRIIASGETHLKEERRYIKKDGSLIWTNVMFALDRIHDEIIITNEDITTRIKAKAARKAYNERLKQSNDALEHFSYVISHDLQEPLRMMTMYTQRIKKKYIPQINDKEAAIDMEFVVGGAKRMSQLIKDLLEYSRVSSVEKVISDIDIEELLFYVKNDLSVSINESNASVEYQGHKMKIKTNRILLKQLFFNLISNSIKYRHPDREPVITIDCKKGEFDYLITVEDNGIGFEAEYNERIFKLFQRLHHRDDYSGTGIGLAICQKSVQQMGGNIWAEGIPDVGATFFIKIPIELELIEG